MTTVFTNPFHTEVRYQPGLDGVYANLGRLEDAFDSSDTLEICTVLADTAACVGIEAGQYPDGCPDVGSASWMLTELRDAVEAEDIREVRSVLWGMVEAMKLGRRRRTRSH